MQWQALMATCFVHAALRKERGRNRALQIKTQWTVSCVIHLPLNSGHKFQPHPIRSKKRKGRLSVRNSPTPRRISPLLIPVLWPSLASWVMLTLKNHQHLQKSKKEKAPVKPNNDKAELDQKWSERCNRLEALLLSKSLQPTFSSEVEVTPSHSPPVNVPRDAEPCFQPSHRTLEDPSPKRTGPDTSAAQQPSAGKLISDSSASSSSSSKRTGPVLLQSRSRPAS